MGFDLEFWQRGSQYFWKLGGASRDWIMVAEAHPDAAARPQLFAVPAGRDAPSVYREVLEATPTAIRFPTSLPADGRDALFALAPHFGRWWHDVGQYAAGYRNNPRAPEWDVLPPNTPYPCHSWEKKMVGKRVPGRNGGVITSCATPREPFDAERRKGQVHIQGVGSMPRQRAYNRIRQAGAKRVSTPVEQVGGAVYGFEHGECAVPGPTGMEFPHIVSRCDLEHPAWAGYLEALVEAQEQAAVFAENAGQEEYDCAVRDALQKHPNYKLWEKTATDCARQFHDREEKRRGKATFSTARESMQKRVRALAAGMDVTSAEYTDTLRGGEGKRKPKRRR